jgi:putative transposase
MRYSDPRAKTRWGFRPCAISDSRTTAVAEQLLQKDFSPLAPKPLLGGWHHLHPHLSRLRVFSRLDRPVQPPRGRLGHWCHHEGNVGDGDLQPASGNRQIESDLLLIHPIRNGSTGQRRTGSCWKLRSIICSMSTKDCYWDNTVVESFFSSLKHLLGFDDEAETMNNPQ